MTGPAGGRRKVHSMADEESEQASTPPQKGLRALGVSLALLLGVMAFSASLDPIVQTFGLAHTRIMTASGGQVLVVDHLPSADAPAVQSLFQGEIWGRHAFTVGQIVLPFAVLLAALASLSYALAHLLCAPGSRFFHLRRGWAPPPLGLWGVLFLGGCFAALTVESPGLNPNLALVPLAVTLLTGVALALTPHPSALWAGRTFTALTGARWFWLGFLTLSPLGLFHQTGPEPGAPTPLLPLSSLLSCVVALAGLSWATRPPKSAAYDRFEGDTARLRQETEGLSLLCIQELWLILPVVLMAASVSSLRFDFLAPYLFGSVACALVMRAAVRASGSAAAAAWRPSKTGAALGLATAGALTLAMSGGVPSAAPSAVATAQAKLTQSFAHQARLLQLNGKALLIGCNLDVAQMSSAAEIVSGHLPETETKVVSVRTRRWERAARITLALTVALFLVLPTFLLTVAQPGPAGRLYSVFCAVLGGINGAFAVGAALGWFWLYPLPHVAAFLLSTALGWLGLGHARAWIDGRVARPAGETAPALLNATRNTTA